MGFSVTRQIRSEISERKKREKVQLVVFRTEELLWRERPSFGVGVCKLGSRGNVNYNISGSGGIHTRITRSKPSLRWQQRRRTPLCS